MDRAWPPPFQEAGAGDSELPTLVLAALIARSPDDSVQVSKADLDRLYELFPHGFGMVVAGRDGDIRVTLIGEQGVGQVRDMVDDLNGGMRPSQAIDHRYMPRP